MGIWTAHEDEKLKTLYADRLSCAAIANYFPNKSRNAIIGRVHRLKMPLRGGGTKPPRAARSTPYPWEEAGKSKSTYYRSRSAEQLPPKPKIIRPPREETELRCDAIDPLSIPLSDLHANQCRWPYGDGPFTFCGHEIFQGSYCGGHFFLSIGAGTGSERAAHKVAKSKLQGAW